MKYIIKKEEIKKAFEHFIDNYPESINTPPCIYFKNRSTYHNLRIDKIKYYIEHAILGVNETYYDEDIEYAKEIKFSKAKVLQLIKAGQSFLILNKIRSHMHDISNIPLRDLPEYFDKCLQFSKDLTILL